MPNKKPILGLQPMAGKIVTLPAFLAVSTFFGGKTFLIRSIKSICCDKLSVAGCVTAVVSCALALMKSVAVKKMHMLNLYFKIFVLKIVHDYAWAGSYAKNFLEHKVHHEHPKQRENLVFKTNPGFNFSRPKTLPVLSSRIYWRFVSNIFSYSPAA